MNTIHTMSDQQRSGEIKSLAVVLAGAVVAAIVMLAAAGAGLAVSIACIGILAAVGTGGIRVMYSRYKAVGVVPIANVTRQATEIAARVMQAAATVVEVTGQAARDTTNQIIALALSRVRERVIAAISIAHAGLVHVALIAARSTTEQAAAG